MAESLPSAPPPGADETTRTLYRIVPLADWRPPENAGPPHMKIAVLDLETEGLDPLYHQILEFSVAMIAIDAEGQILSVDGPYTGLRDPGRPIEIPISKITGITDDMVAGQTMSGTKIAAFLGRANACLSFNVRFDRQYLEMLVPEVGEMPWICAMADVPWLDLGFDGKAQNYLLAQAAMFNPVAHRAADDVASLVNLLAHECRDGRTVMAHALEGAKSPTWRFEASDLPHRLQKDAYRHAYRRSYHGVYHKLVREAEHDAEVAWYRELVGRDPTIVPVDWVQRYRADWTWEPVNRKVEVAHWRR
jgi:DNA polymerase-3 subunit epsilon|tara:strand:- start:331 stop:1245 length:915 start_codon:yes stop_codon:yes gene_type:complete